LHKDLLALEQIDINLKDQSNKTAVREVNSEETAKFLADYIQQSTRLADEQKQELLRELLIVAIDHSWKDLYDLLKEVQREDQDNILLLDEVASKAYEKGASEILLSMIEQKQKLTPSFFKTIHFQSSTTHSPLNYSNILRLMYDVNATDKEGNTLIGVLVAQGCGSNHLQLIEELIRLQADLNMPDLEGMTPLAFCLTSGASDEESTQIASLLIKAGADAKYRTPQSKKTLIHLVGKHLSQANLKLLLEAGVNINAQDSQGDTALHQAILEGNTTAATALLTSGAEVNLRNDNGLTPLQTLHQHMYLYDHHEDTKDQAILNLLLQLGAHE
jgi:hypothetical protein